jgi:MOSC domain-containing protein YiiM
MGGEMTARVEAIYIAPESGAAMVTVTVASLIADCGIEGDRNFNAAGVAPGNQVTLIEAEAVERFNAATGLAISPAAPRRNIVTRGVALNALVGKEFSVGPTTLQGVEWCEPCATLGKRIATGAVDAARVVKTFAHQAGLRARVVSGGTVAPGDAIGI